MFLGGPLDMVVGIGGATVIIAISNYTLDATPPHTIIISSSGAKEGDNGGNNKA